MKGFSAEIYAAESTTRIGQLMMEDIISMHMELQQFYGPEDSGCVQWMKWQELDKLPDVMQDIICGGDGTQLGEWFALYRRWRHLNMPRKLVMVAHWLSFSSGLDIGTCNWVVRSPKREISYLLMMQKVLKKRLITHPRTMKFFREHF